MMETMHAARRSLPPVPRARRGRGVSTGAASEPVAPHASATAESGPGSDVAQEFVARLRAAAADFAAAAGAESAVVREAVPPARHRRARCRVVLRFSGSAATVDTEADVTFLGPAGEPGSPSRHGFDRQIRRWLAAGRPRDDGWLVADPDARDGVAVDVAAWLAAR
jgi:hypothetical protein